MNDTAFKSMELAHGILLKKYQDTDSTSREQFDWGATVQMASWPLGLLFNKPPS